MRAPRAFHSRAFTLIELLVVIAIIAILAAILFPVFAQAKNAAKKTQDLSNMKNIATATIMYMGDSDDVLPMLRNGQRDWGCAAHGTNPCEQVSVAHTMIAPYIKSRDIWKSPQDSLVHGPDPYGVKDLGGAISYVFTYWNSANVATGGTFGLMGWDNAVLGTGAPASTAQLNSNSGSSIDASANTILAVPLYCTWSYWNGLMQYRADSRWLAYDADGAKRAGATTNLSLYISNYPKFDDYGAVWGGTHDGFSMGSWGGKSTNFTFVDGHAKAMARESTLDPMWLSDPANAIAQNKKNLFHPSGQYKQ